MLERECLPLRPDGQVWRAPNFCPTDDPSPASPATIPAPSRRAEKDRETEREGERDAWAEFRVLDKPAHGKRIEKAINHESRPAAKTSDSVVEGARQQRERQKTGVVRH